MQASNPEEKARMIRDWLRKEEKHKEYPQGVHPVANRIRVQMLKVGSLKEARDLKAKYEKELAKLEKKSERKPKKDE